MKIPARMITFVRTNFKTMGKGKKHIATKAGKKTTTTQHYRGMHIVNEIEHWFDGLWVVVQRCEGVAVAVFRIVVKA